MPAPPAPLPLFLRDLIAERDRFRAYDRLVALVAEVSRHLYPRLSQLASELDRDIAPRLLDASSNTEVDPDTDALIRAARSLLAAPMLAIETLVAELEAHRADLLPDLLPPVPTPAAVAAAGTLTPPPADLDETARRDDAPLAPILPGPGSAVPPKATAPTRA